MASGEGCCALRLSSQNISHRHRDYRELHAGPGCGAGGGQPPVQLGQVSGSFIPAVPRPSISPAASGARSHCTLSHKPSFSPCRLNRLEQALARSKPGKEGCHFQTNLVEAHVYSVSADSFKGLNLSSSAVSTPVLPGSACSMHTASPLHPSSLHGIPLGGLPGWLSVTYAGVDEEQVGFGHLLSMLCTSPTPGDVAPGKPAADAQRRHWGASAAR